MIIKSLLSQDLYKFTMLNVFHRQFPDAEAKYRFKCRNKDVDLLPCMDEINQAFDDLCNLRFTQDELNYLSSFPFFNQHFINFLEDFQLKRRYINVGEKDGKLDICADGPLINVMMFEIFVLKIVHDVYTRKFTFSAGAENIGRNNLIRKIALFHNFVKETGITPQIIDFGGRRAFTVDWHEFVLKNFKRADVIVGTSDVELAFRHNLKCIGTFAHEYTQLFQAFVHPMDSQSQALQTWYDTYEGKLGIALSDTLGDKKFLIDFDPYFANVYQGVRHDSGDPVIWGDMMIHHYRALDIDPMTKTLVFSDGLDMPKVFELAKYFDGKINVTFGVGTNLTNDCGVPALQNVMKLIEVDGHPVAKISNNPDKAMCEDQNYLNYLKGCLAKI
jgi:nicotinate phosphoribosyltransferase